MKRRAAFALGLARSGGPRDRRCCRRRRRRSVFRWPSASTGSSSRHAQAQAATRRSGQPDPGAAIAGAALQGQVEELKHQLDEAKQRNKDQYIDLDSRIGRLEGQRSGRRHRRRRQCVERATAQPPDIELGDAGGSRRQPARARGVRAPNAGDLTRRGIARRAQRIWRMRIHAADPTGEQSTYDARSRR